MKTEVRRYNNPTADELNLIIRTIDYNGRRAVISRNDDNDLGRCIVLGYNLSDIPAVSEGQIGIAIIPAEEREALSDLVTRSFHGVTKVDFWDQDETDKVELQPGISTVEDLETKKARFPDCLEGTLGEGFIIAAYDPFSWTGHVTNYSYETDPRALEANLNELKRECFGDLSQVNVWVVGGSAYLGGDASNLRRDISVMSKQLEVEELVGRFFDYSKIQVRWLPEGYFGEFSLDSDRGEFSLEAKSFRDILREVDRTSEEVLGIEKFRSPDSDSSDPYSSVADGIKVPIGASIGVIVHDPRSGSGYSIRDLSGLMGDNYLKTQLELVLGDYIDSSETRKALDEGTADDLLEALENTLSSPRLKIYVAGGSYHPDIHMDEGEVVSRRQHVEKTIIGLLEKDSLPENVEVTWLENDYFGEMRLDLDGGELEVDTKPVRRGRIPESEYRRMERMDRHYERGDE